MEGRGVPSCGLVWIQGLGSRPVKVTIAREKRARQEQRERVRAFDAPNAWKSLHSPAQGSLAFPPPLTALHSTVAGPREQPVKFTTHGSATCTTAGLDTRVSTTTSLHPLRLLAQQGTTT